MAGSVLLVNATKGKRKSPRKVARPTPRRNASAPKRKGRKGRRRPLRNPLAMRLGLGRRSGLVGNLTGQATAAGVGLLGAVANDVVMKLVPVEVKAGPLGHVAKAGLAVALGLAGGTKRPLVAQAANGALIVALYGAYSQYLKGQLHLGEYTDGDMEALGAYEAVGVPSLGVSSQPALGLGEYVGEYEYAQ